MAARHLCQESESGSVLYLIRIWFVICFSQVRSTGRRRQPGRARYQRLTDGPIFILGTPVLVCMFPYYHIRKNTNWKILTRLFSTLNLQGYFKLSCSVVPSFVKSYVTFYMFYFCRYGLFLSSRLFKGTVLRDFFYQLSSSPTFDTWHFQTFH